MVFCAWSEPAPSARPQAMGRLQAALAAAVRPEGLPPVQHAFYTVVDAMIERTKAAVAAQPAGQAAS